jgi:hypothetical protein
MPLASMTNLEVLGTYPKLHVITVSRNFIMLSKTNCTHTIDQMMCIDVMSNKCGMAVGTHFI